MSEEIPSGVPDDDTEAPPMGVPADADERDEAEKELPGIPSEGEPPTAG
jgi:hypothetical protein